MTLKELRDRIESFGSPDTIMNFSLTDVFSWRGVYAEVCFSLSPEKTTVKENLAQIDYALSDEFEGYKGGSFRYTLNTPVNFETDISEYSDKRYIRNFLKNNIDNEDVQKILGDYLSEPESFELKKCCLNCMEPYSKTSECVFCTYTDKNIGKRKKIDNPAEYNCSHFFSMSGKKCSYCECYEPSDNKCYHYNHVRLDMDPLTGRTSIVSDKEIFNMETEAENCPCYVEFNFIKNIRNQWKSLCIKK